MKANVNKVSGWLKDYLTKTGFEGYLLGLSGGIDSAVSLGLAVKGVGAEKVRCFALPCTCDFEQARKEDEDDAQLVADTFGVKLERIFLDEEATKLYVDVLPHNIHNSHLVLPNIKARLRMVTLRALAEGLGYLVLGTTNKTEEYLGYYTKAGDGGAGVDVEPIADYFKYEIRAMARELGVPEVVITKAPSAGLWYNQTDEDEIGFKYDDIDKYLSIREDILSYNPSVNSKLYQKYVLKTATIDGLDIKWSNLFDYMMDRPKVLAAKVNPKLIDRVERMIVAGNHKRNNPPFFNRLTIIDSIAHELNIEEVLK